MKHTIAQSCDTFTTVYWSKLSIASVLQCDVIKTFQFKFTQAFLVTVTLHWSNYC